MLKSDSFVLLFNPVEARRVRDQGKNIPHLMTFCAVEWVLQPFYYHTLPRFSFISNLEVNWKSASTQVEKQRLWSQTEQKYLWSIAFLRQELAEIAMCVFIMRLGFLQAGPAFNECQMEVVCGWYGFGKIPLRGLTLHSQYVRLHHWKKYQLHFLHKDVYISLSLLRQSVAH